MKQALDYINVIRKIIGDSNRSVVDCSKLGFFHIFAEMKDKNKLWSYIPESLQMLYDYDKKRDKELINTLECFMNNNQSYKKNFDNVTEMLAVRNGLIILRIIEAM